MEGLYLLIRTGYEGIEELIFPTMDKELAIQKINDLRQEITEARVEGEKLGLIIDDSKDWEEEYKRVDKLLEKNEGYYEIKWKMDENPDFYCIQQYINDGFKCVCVDLDVKPSQQMWR